MSTFALVHGAWHGAWCWERLVGPLRERGHEVVAPELPQPQRSQTEPSPALPQGLRVESIIGANDQVVSPSWSRHVARDRLGVEPIELPTGHFPMITHPELLADALAQLDSE